jgi:hypothetical protein
MFVPEVATIDISQIKRKPVFPIWQLKKKLTQNIQD